MAKRIRIALIAAAMTLLLAMGAAAVNVHAAATKTKGGSASETVPIIEKTINVAPGVTIPDNVVFTISQTKNNDGTVKNNADGTKQAATVGDFTVTIPKESFNTDELKQSTSGRTVEASLTNDQKETLASKLTTVGEYTFTVTETAPANKGKNDTYGWTKDSTTYYLHVFKDSNQKVTYLVTESDALGDTVDKLSSMDFTNTYTKAAAPLKLQKTTENDSYVDASTGYKFTVKLENVAPNTLADTYTATKYTADNKVDRVTLSSSENGTEVTLKKGEYIIAENLPAGTKVTITENASDLKNLTGVTVNGDKITGSNNQYTYTIDNLTENGQNNAIFKNSFQTTTLTGVITQIAPFIAMVAIAGGAVALYLVSRKRRDA